MQFSFTRVCGLSVAILLGAGCVSAPDRSAGGHPANPATAASAPPARSTTLGTEGFGVLFAPKGDAPAAHHHHAHSAPPPPAETPPPAPAEGTPSTDAPPAGTPSAGPPANATSGERAPAEPKRVRKPKKAPVVYVCPMHPDVTSATPGTCPKCHMQLERRTP